MLIAQHSIFLYILQKKLHCFYIAVTASSDERKETVYLISLSFTQLIQNNLCIWHSFKLVGSCWLEISYWVKSVATRWHRRLSIFPSDIECKFTDSSWISRMALLLVFLMNTKSETALTLNDFNNRFSCYTILNNLTDAKLSQLFLFIERCGGYSKHHKPLWWPATRNWLKSFDR